MMKKLFSLTLTSIAIIIFFSSCSDTETYADLLATENASIADFISRNNIKVISEVPADSVWGENEYLKTSTGLYIHIVNPGEAGNTVTSGQTVLVRYYKITLAAQPDTIIRKWTVAESPNPYEFAYNVSDDVTSNAFHEAVSYMKRHNSVAKLIVPSKIGTTADIKAVVPYFYDFKLKLTE